MLQAANFIRTPKDVAYYMHLDNPRVLRGLRYRFKYNTVIYGVRCQVTNMVYIGSTFAPSLRFHQHFVSGYNSNLALQNAIQTYGLSKFTVNVFEIVNFPDNTTYWDKKAILLKIEQTYIDKFPTSQTYNSINASNKS